MQLRAILALVSLLILPGAMAAPTQEAEGLEARQYYDGPCSNEDCGVNRVNCLARSKWCVRYPSITEPKGCTCSSL
ncbi:hypothetical protein DL764_007753 [Monosporascus ibericus]|uniref:Uncharacterized protein n=1 Tax=Monosporascus ibericus TaxID=155417 RepID=A0A4Q4SZA4_9PEZI|nr:hypothetical protein DL764_007753 [Monosporascus ibericus]